MIKAVFTVMVDTLSKNIFSASIAINMFSTTVFLISLTFLGYSELAADVAIIQGATHAVFMAFSANARNLILSVNDNNIFNQQFFFRLYLLIPLSLIAYFLSGSIFEISSIIIVLFVFRRGGEWIAELLITEAEKNSNEQYARRFFYIQLISLVILLGYLALDEKLNTSVLFFWALSPLLQITPFLVKIWKDNNEKSGLTFNEFIPHIGSSWIIAISIYVFRVLIVLLVGRSFGGMLFSAYAIGGMVSSIYTYAIGPSQVFNKESFSYSRFTKAIVVFLIASGICIFLSSIMIFDGFDNVLFIKSIGLSMIGSGVMILAISHRIYNLQVLNSSVFIQDILINILIVSTLPFFVAVFGKESLSSIFLWNASLSYVFYSFSTHSVNIRGGHNKLYKFEYIQAILLFLLFIPVFIQIDGGIFTSSQMFFDSIWNLTKLPLPLALIACFVGIALLVKQQTPQFSAFILFMFFILMLMSTFLLSSITESKTAIGKLIYLFQFILPAFALVLGQSYRTPSNLKLSYEAVFLYVLVILVPLEVVATYIQHTEFLTPYLYYFSIYQHLQYVPTIFVSGYLIALYSLHDHHKMRRLLLYLFPFMIAYVILSTSIIALLLFCIGIFVAFIKLMKKYEICFNYILMLFLVLVVLYTVSFEFDSLSLARENINNLIFSETLFKSNSDNVLMSMDKKIQFWTWHYQGITGNIESLMFGHMYIPDRTSIPSAYNYYLDLVYGFGLFALLPFIYMLFYTLKSYIISLKNGVLPRNTTSLLMIVLYFILVGSFFDVGFRQPYPGIIMFFIWGVLLNRVSFTKTINSGDKGDL